MISLRNTGWESCSTCHTSGSTITLDLATQCLHSNPLTALLYRKSNISETALGRCRTSHRHKLSSIRTASCRWLLLGEVKHLEQWVREPCDSPLWFVGLASARGRAKQGSYHLHIAQRIVALVSSAHSGMSKTVGRRRRLFPTFFQATDADQKPLSQDGDGLRRWK